MVNRKLLLPMYLLNKEVLYQDSKNKQIIDLRSEVGDLKDQLKKISDILK